MKKRNGHLGDIFTLPELADSHIELKHKTQTAHEEFMEGMKEVRQILLEVGKKQDRAEKEMAELRQSIKEQGKNIGGLNSAVGSITESLIQGGINKFLYDTYGIQTIAQYDNFNYKSSTKVDYEADFFIHAKEGKENIAILGEVKTSLDTKDLEKINNRIDIFKEYIGKNYPEALKHNMFLVVIGFSKVDKYAKNYIIENALEDNDYIFVKAGGDGSVKPYYFKK